MKIGKKSVVTVIILLLLSVISSNVIAQEKQKETTATDKIVTKLQQKVLLNDDQASKVKSILISYLDGDKGSENLVEAQRKIEALFDAKQKAKYDIIKEDWWKSVKKSSAK